MDPVELLRRSGGIAGPVLIRACGRRPVREASSAGLIVRVGRGRYALPAVADSLGVAHGVSGVLSHLSAARFWGWEVATPLSGVEVVVPRDRRIRRPSTATIRRRDLRPGDVSEPGVTSPLRTVLDVASDHPFVDALAVADSALRSRSITADELVAAALASPGRGHARRCTVAVAADSRADNQFESALRALAIEARLDVEPQLWLHTGDRWVRPDLLDERRGLALEAESFTWHGRRTQLMRDCRKYNDLTLLGLTVVRFAWEHVMLERAYTRSVLRACRNGPQLWRSAEETHPSHVA
jgi:hypothetical protein